MPETDRIYTLEALLAIQSAKRTKVWSIELRPGIPKALQAPEFLDNSSSSASSSSSSKVGKPWRNLRSAAGVADSTTGLPVRFTPSRRPNFQRQPAGDRRKFGKEAHAGGGWRAGLKETISVKLEDSDPSTFAGWKTSFKRGGQPAAAGGASSKQSSSKGQNRRSREPAWADGSISAVDTDTFSLADVKVLARDEHLRRLPPKKDSKSESRDLLRPEPITPARASEPVIQTEDDDIDSFFAGAARDLGDALPDVSSELLGEGGTDIQQEPSILLPGNDGDAFLAQQATAWGSLSQPVQQNQSSIQSSQPQQQGFSVDLNALFGSEESTEDTSLSSFPSSSAVASQQQQQQPQEPSPKTATVAADNLTTPDSKPKSERLNKLLSRSKRRLKMSPSAKQQKREEQHHTEETPSEALPSSRQAVSPSNAPAAASAGPSQMPPAVQQQYPLHSGPSAGVAHHYPASRPPYPLPAMSYPQHHPYQQQHQKRYPQQQRGDGAAVAQNRNPPIPQKYHQPKRQNLYANYPVPPPAHFNQYVHPPSAPGAAAAGYPPPGPSPAGVSHHHRPPVPDNHPNGNPHPPPHGHMRHPQQQQYQGNQQSRMPTGAQPRPQQQR